MRRRTWVLVGAGVGVAALLGTGIGLAARYQPLVTGGLNTGSGPVSYREGGVVIIGPSLTNEGHFTVRITGADLPSPQPRSMLRMTALRTNIPGQAWRVDEDGTMPFQPFDLGPGDTRLLLIEMTMGDCAHFGVGTVSSVDEVVVHYSFLGFDHRAELSADPGATVTAPSNADCPQRSQVIPPHP